MFNHSACFDQSSNISRWPVPGNFSIQEQTSWEEKVNDSCILFKISLSCIQRLAQSLIENMGKIMRVLHILSEMF